jgi:hypothetical protein
MRDPNVTAAMAVFDKSASRTVANAQTAAWSVLRDYIDRLEAATPQPASADVDDAMVERALSVLADHGVLSILTDYESDKAATRVALVAAIKGDSHAG